MFVLRIFSCSRQIKIMVWAGILFTGTTYMAFFIGFTILAVPANTTNRSELDAKFFTRFTKASQISSLILGALGILTDLYVIAIPIMAVSKLNMTTKRKVGLSILFTTGLLYVCIHSLPSVSI